MDDCKNCYSCQADISPRITADDIRANGGKIKPEWANDETRERCSSCFVCQQCVSVQQNECRICVSCEQCNVKQA